jgi:hypothetical protein
MTPFGTWLAEIGLGRYDAVFASNEIDFDVIRSLTEADLRELGLALGDRKRLLRAVVRLNEPRTADIVSPLDLPEIASKSLGRDVVSYGGERRQLTVMFCDLVGSTAFMVAEASGGKRTARKTFLAEAMALTGDLDNALLVADETIALIERPGWEERFNYAEILRLKGWMLSLKGDLEGAEQNYIASLDCARRQQAKSWELRTSASLARLWLGQGKRQDAYDLLAPVYDWFTEGFDTKDLQDAKALLAELG